MAESPRIPTLVQYCQKVAAAHVESIVGFGDNIPYELIRPILEHCSAESLMRVEDASPHLTKCTGELWEQRCYRDLRLESEPYRNGSHDHPPSWRLLYEELAELRARKLKEAGSRLRISRMSEEQRRKEKNIKITDKLPPEKRTRIWGTTAPPKTLFQKTRTEASKMQRVFDKQMRPPMPTSKSYRTSSISASTVPLLSPPSTITMQANPRVLVRPVISHRTTVNCASQPDPPTSHTSPTPSAPRSGDVASLSHSMASSNLATPVSSTELSTRPARSLPIMKRPPSSALFMPKHRAYSQLSGRVATVQPPS